MFSGIVQSKAEVTKVNREKGLFSFSIGVTQLFAKGIKAGASVSVDGVCLTLVQKGKSTLLFDATNETLSRTTLGSLTPGAFVNIERSLRSGEENGGHFLSGHIFTVGRISEIQTGTNSYILTCQAPAEFMKYVFYKGFIALNGVSLTIIRPDLKKNTFAVSLIPETLRITTFSMKKPGESVNLEVDTQTQIIVDTLERILLAKKST